MNRKKLLLFLWIPLILYCFFTAPKASPFSVWSMESFRSLFRWESVRQVFDLEEPEAREVFGEQDGGVFL